MNNARKCFFISRIRMLDAFGALARASLFFRTAGRFLRPGLEVAVGPGTSHVHDDNPRDQ